MIKTEDRHKGTKTQRESKSKQKIDTKAQRLKEKQNQNRRKTQRLKEKQKISNTLIEKALSLRAFES
ncbi:MAG TPA: hypothetical protein PKD94_07835 [Ignavibacteria bacterium]|nr:hypothetical protein [Ignavibacteria bacterium]